MSEQELTPKLAEAKLQFNRIEVSYKVRKTVAAQSGNRCAFPGCEQELMLDGEAFIGELASIEAIHGAGPRFNKDSNPSKLASSENFLLLCPNHHRIIDQLPERYTAEWLREAREAHLDRVREALSQGVPQPKIKLAPQVEVSLQEAVGIWNAFKENASEEFWQELFEQCPMLIAQLFPRSAFQIGSKSYVGGKSLDNAGGNLVDFVYASKTTNNVVLVEIKTPKTKLLGKRYRNNAYSLSEDLTGSIVQILNYKDSMIKEYYSLSNGQTPFSAFLPKCVVIAGSVESEMDTATKLKSFELFRNEGSGVDLVSFDELFDKVQSILDITTSKPPNSTAHTTDSPSSGL